MVDRFAFRDVPCPDCFDGRYEVASGPGYVSHRCDTCEGSGEIEAICRECGKVVPIDPEGVCERCDDASTLPLAEFNARYRERLAVEPRSELHSPDGWSHAA